MKFMISKQELTKKFVLSIERERINLNLTQAQMAAKMQMSLSGYKKMVSGATTRIDLHIVYLLHSITGRWIYDFIDEHNEDSDLFLKIKQLSPSQKRTVKSLVNFELGFLNSHDPSSPDDPQDYITVYVPTGNMEDGMILDSYNYKKVNAAPYRKRFGDRLHCGIQLTSDHLHPVYHQGDILLICRDSVREGDTGIFLNKKTGRTYIRRYSVSDFWVLDPISSYGTPIVIDRSNEEEAQSWVCSGYVLSKMREEAEPIA